MIKTYGIRGLMECMLRLPTGLKKQPYVDIHFQGGQISGFGTAPARFTTADPLLQFVIEHSRLFGLDNKISLLDVKPVFRQRKKKKE